ncbi:MAG: hypothetical protein MjAS7_2901 [Metallosphaera javensis (ex Sakai et al. 2022)]|nr:MAG: hypothetical protein MjAS7_2901 [Metallosphaera javensis (ex Sakai et al. 2022)]
MILFDSSSALRDTKKRAVIGPPRSGKSTFLTYCNLFPSCNQNFPECLSLQCKDKEGSLSIIKDHLNSSEKFKDLPKRIIRSIKVGSNNLSDANFYLDENQAEESVSIVSSLRYKFWDQPSLPQNETYGVPHHIKAPVHLGCLLEPHEPVPEGRVEGLVGVNG